MERYVYEALQSIARSSRLNIILSEKLNTPFVDIILSQSYGLPRNNRRRRVAEVLSLRWVGDAHAGRILQVHGGGKKVRADFGKVRRRECTGRVEATE